MIKRGKLDKQAARKARLSAALRENLKRRKRQSRDRAAAGERMSDLPDQDLPDQDLPERDLPDEDTQAKRAPKAGSVPGFRHNRSDE
jgi:hypothetical protein